MIDTIGVQYPYEVDKNELQRWEYHRTSSKSGFVMYYRLKVRLENKTEITYTYYPYALGGSSLLRVEFSMPNLVMGNNVQMIYNLQTAITKANGSLPAIPGVPKLDLWEGILYRLDVCYNHQVGDLVPYYIKALQHLKYPFRKTRPYTSEGVQYGNGSVSTKFYDKFKESKLSTATGILRQETTIRKRKLKTLLDKKTPTLRDITIEFLLNTLDSDLKELGLLGKSIGTKDTVLEQLTADHGGNAAMFYYGLIMAGMEHPKESIAQAAGVHPRTLEKRMKKIAETVEPVVITEHEKPLPPLCIDREKVKQEAEQ